MNLPARRRWVPVVAAALCALFVAGLGGAVTDLSPWYYGLRQPAWKPPDLWFGPVWTLIFSLAAISGVLAWRNAARRADRIKVLALFAVNAVLNVGWSLLFFRLHRPDWSLIEVVALWLAIAVMMFALAPLSRLASALLLPYLLWVSFAATLNLAVVRLNGPFQ
jgi:tryptophan-rich sensory protein